MSERLRIPNGFAIARVAGIIALVAGISFLPEPERPTLSKRTKPKQNSEHSSFQSRGFTRGDADKLLAEATTRSLGSGEVVPILRGECIVVPISPKDGKDMVAVIQNPIRIETSTADGTGAAVLGSVMPSRDRDFDGSRKHAAYPMREVDGQLEFGQKGMIPGVELGKVDVVLTRSEPQISRSDDDVLGASEAPLGGYVSLMSNIDGTDIPPAHLIYRVGNPNTVQDECFIP